MHKFLITSLLFGNLVHVSLPNDPLLNEKDDSLDPPTVAIIGGGPASMFFCHTVETRRREMMSKGATDAELARLPIVTAFERAGGPGGVWRSERSFGSADCSEEEITSDRSCSPFFKRTFESEKSWATTATTTTAAVAATTTATPNMYEALWTNGPKDCIEFSDYRLDQHFPHPLPVYMPRHSVLDYMIGRVTQHCPHFFEKYVRFNTNVDFVRYNDTKRKFEVTTRDMLTGELSTREYDKCIWAGGENGRPNLPEPMIALFREGGFAGKLIHSSDTTDFEADVKGKRILLVGGSYSAEDLALMAIKCGVDKVYISSRQWGNAVTWTGAWPYDKVQVLEAQTPVNVTEDGKCIQFAMVQLKWPNQYIPDEEVKTEICDIDVIIFCTGYLPNFDMLDEDLRSALKWDIDTKLEVPSEWRMSPNGLSELQGDVEPGDCRIFNSCIGYPGLYRGLSISNSNMMFIVVTGVDNPLVGVDVASWLLLNFITGVSRIPTAEEMREQNSRDALDQMRSNIYLRYWMDYNYYKAFEDMYYEEGFEKRETLSRFFYKSKSQHYDFYWKILARSMQEVDYPVSYGTYDELNHIALTLKEYSSMSYYDRANLTADDAASGMTFRDTNASDQFRSIFTGDKAVPLKYRWLDIDANDESVLEI